ncbi:TPA: hypothetical protein QFT03_000338 [Kluyvera ascorbata]|nr:hypothetical protein [Citrobacter freundii]HDT6543437.1 hypothetical protein [Kluyvera ascorbata]HED1544943.1 hypothetical protein [Citrobacter freundii]
MSVKKENETMPQSGCSTVWNVLHLAAENIPTERERDKVRCDAEAHRDALLSGLETLGMLLSESTHGHQFNDYEIMSVGDFIKSSAALINGMNTLITGCDELNDKNN